MRRKLIETKDGSSSLLVEEWGETYHSVHGAVQEALHVYIQNGLLRHEKSHLKILEIGFGTGLNFCLSLQESQKHHKSFDYFAVEGFPISKEEWQQLSYGAYFTSEKVDFDEIHELPWEEKHHFDGGFSLYKHQTMFEEFDSNERFDVIYYDAFAYNYQPELWSEEMLGKMRRLLAPDGFLVTYACKGIINRTLKSVGFRVEKVPGPIGKREMTIAYQL